MNNPTLNSTQFNLSLYRQQVENLSENQLTTEIKSIEEQLSALNSNGIPKNGDKEKNSSNKTFYSRKSSRRTAKNKDFRN